jgi:hypothetical protein
MLGQKTFRAAVEDGSAQAEGDIDILAQIASTLVNFEIGFEVLPGTAGPAGQVDLEPYAVADDSIQMSGE